MRRVATGGAGIEGEFRGPRVAAETEHVLPRAVVGCAGRLGAQAGGVIEQLLDRDLRLARVAQRLGPGNELKRRVVEAHLLRRQALTALLGGNRQHRRTDGLGDRGDAAGIGLGAVAAFDFEHNVPRRITTAAKLRLSLCSSHCFKSSSLAGSIPAIRRMSSGLSSLRQPPCDSGGGKYVGRAILARLASGDARPTYRVGRYPHNHTAVGGERRGSVVTHGEDNVNRLAGGVGGNMQNRTGRRRILQGHLALVRAGLAIDEPFIGELVAIGVLRESGIERYFLAGSSVHPQNLLSVNSVDDGVRSVVRLARRLHAPVEPRPEIVLQIRRPAGERIVAVGRAVPRVGLVGPVVPLAGEVLIEAVAARPTAPERLVRIVHARSAPGRGTSSCRPLSPSAWCSSGTARRAGRGR